ncbi:hypothetical protein EDB85DRAFT_1893540 [Lactarius pseudohatsudake]|nr:hypothetical protein EDB85DRAFT_1893540 [Lactarius pseudohatsudake]
MPVNICLTQKLDHAPTEDVHRPQCLADGGSTVQAFTCVYGHTALSFVLAVCDNWEWFPEPEVMSQVLTYLGNIKRIHELTTPSFDMAFATCWMCMALVAVHRMLNTATVQSAAGHVITCLAKVRGRKVLDEVKVVAKTTKNVDHHVKSGWDAVNILHTGISLNFEVEPKCEKIEGRLQEILKTRDTKGTIKQLQNAWDSLDWADQADKAVIDLVETMLSTTSRVLKYLPCGPLMGP